MPLPSTIGADSTATPLLAVRSLQVTLTLPDGTIRPVDHIDLAVDEGETLCLVGESGCGKSLAALAILGLLPRPYGSISDGSVRFRGAELAGESEARLRKVRGREIGLIFQEPQSALNPVIKVGAQVMEAVRAHGGSSRAEARAKARALLAEVGLPAPEERMHAYPHELSGGMRQRVCIAIALAGDPRLLIADEPTTALDVTVQAQILGLLADLRCKRGMGLLLITHDLALVAQMADRVAVMYAGRIVETGSVTELFAAPRHPYTRGLLDSLPDRRTDRAGEPLRAIAGTVPSPDKLPSGCRFRDRCAWATAKCAAVDPEPTPIPPASEHLVACHHPFRRGSEPRGDAAIDEKERE